MQDNKPTTECRPMYGISRIDDPLHRTHAWRVSLRRRGERLVKNFPDRKWGGRQKALALATQHRDRLLAEHPPLTRAEFADRRRRNNRSGVTGVCLVGCKYHLADGRERCLWYWEAIWPTTPGQHVNKRFSVQTYGKERGFAVACRARRHGLRKVEGNFWVTERGIRGGAGTTRRTRRR